MLMLQYAMWLFNYCHVTSINGKWLVVANTLAGQLLLHATFLFILCFS